MSYRAIVLAASVIALAACHAPPMKQPAPQAQPVEPQQTEPEPSTETPETTTPGPQPAANADVANVPPCLPEVTKPKVTAKRRPRPPQDSGKPAPLEAPPQRVSSVAPAVKPIEGSVSSILGKKVQGQDGEDLGRVVDVQADASGRVRLVIIEFGGFLGVGNRRAAVDWSLLRFHPDDPERPLSLAVDSKEVQNTPEYRQASHPQALMAPIPAPASTPAPDAPSSQPQTK
jgi:PRC-barrel domain